MLRARGVVLLAFLLGFQLVQSIGVPRSYLAYLFGSEDGHPEHPASDNQQIPLELDSLRRTALGTSASGATQYLLGVGKADITGPVVELEFMGYANLDQIGTGLRQRLYARTFIVGDPNNAADRFAYMILDTQSGDTAIRYGILDGLTALGSNFSMYGQKNVAVVGTHSHSGPGAWLNYLLPTITSKGFDPQSYQAIVNGSILSFQRAHENLELGTLSYGSTPLTDASINRSPYAYVQNPASERGQYQYDTDREISLLKFTRASDNKDKGILTWFPVHGTSMLGNNTLASGDNKGVAADMFEKYMTGSTVATDDFVAGFSQANVGDTTPNILGAWCEDGSNVMCTYEQSLCSGYTENCHGRGPNFTVKDNGATSCYTIGSRQFEAAQSLYESNSLTPITGTAVRAYHTFQNMTNFSFTLPNGTAVNTCAAALGYSFAGGTSDWPGAFDFKQGENDTDPKINPVWYAVRDLLHDPSQEQIKCQSPKPILLDVGNMNVPYAWTPDIADIQSFRVGQMFFIISPGEATTMTGRRWRKAVADAAKSKNMTSGVAPIVVLGAPANSYTHYIATPEEYSVQRYEGASTLYGQWTQPAYVNLTLTHLPYLADTPPSTPLAPGPLPPNNVKVALDFITGVVYDNPVVGKSFGDVMTDAPKTAKQGDEINCTFVGADPRNDLKLESNYATIESKQTDGSWKVVRDDSSWDLILNWLRLDTVLGTSSVTLQWKTGDVGTPLPAGTYRMRYYGNSKAPLTGKISPFNGTSGQITIG